MERSSCCSRSHSDERARGRLLIACLAAALGAVPALGGAVNGSISVQQATIRPDGPKHDRDVVVMLEKVGVATHPPGDGNAAMDQRGLVFLPHVLAVRKGSTVRFLNNDNDNHNVYFLNENDGKTLDIGTWGPGVSVDHRFTQAGPVIVLCKLHLEMAAYIVVSESPWFATAQFDPVSMKAAYSIDDVPPGKYRVTAWHKKLKQTAPLEITVPEKGAVDAPLVLSKPGRRKKG